MPHQNSVAVIILCEDLCGSAIAAPTLSKLLIALTGLESTFHVFLGSTRKQMVGAETYQTLLYKNHPVELLFVSEVAEFESIAVVSGNQLIDAHWLTSLKAQLQSSTLEVIQTELGTSIENSDIKSFFPFPTWRNIGSTHPYIEHGGFILNTSAIQKLNKVAQAKSRNWIAFSQEILKTGVPLFLSQKLKTTEQAIDPNPWRALQFIYRTSLSLKHVQKEPKRISKSDKGKLEFQKIDPGRPIVSRLIAHNQSTILVYILTFLSMTFSFVMTTYRSFFPLVDNTPKTALIKLDQGDDAPLHLSSKFWVLVEDDRTRLGEWEGGDNIVARSASHLFFQCLLKGKSALQEIVTEIAKLYRQPDDLIANDLKKYVKELTEAKVLVKEDA